MKTLARSHLLWLAVVFVGLFFMASRIMPASALVEVINSLSVFTAAACVAVFAPLWWPVIRRGDADNVARLGVGVLLVCLSVMSTRGWSMFWRAAGFPSWMASNSLVALWPYVGILGLCMLITVPGTEDGHVIGRSWITLLIAVAVGALAAGFLIGATWSVYVDPGLPL